MILQLVYCRNILTEKGKQSYIKTITSLASKRVSNGKSCSYLSKRQSAAEKKCTQTYSEMQSHSVVLLFALLLGNVWPALLCLHITASRHKEAKTGGKENKPHLKEETGGRKLDRVTARHLKNHNKVRIIEYRCKEVQRKSVLQFLLSWYRRFKLIKLIKSYDYWEDVNAASYNVKPNRFTLNKLKH